MYGNNSSWRGQVLSSLWEIIIWLFPEKAKKEILYPIVAWDYEQQQVQWKLIG